MGFIQFGVLITQPEILKQQQLYDKQGQCSVGTEVNWTWVWKVNLPNKVKVFLWRILKNSLLIYELLRKKCVDVLNVCTTCKYSPETLLHVFRDCAYARLFWAMSNLPHHILSTTSSTMCDWIESVRHLDLENEFEIFACSCWGLWYYRNEKSACRLYT